MNLLAKFIQGVAERRRIARLLKSERRRSTEEQNREQELRRVVLRRFLSGSGKESKVQSPKSKVRN